MRMDQTPLSYKSALQFKAFSEFMLTLDSISRWLFLVEKATELRWFRPTPIPKMLSREKVLCVLEPIAMLRDQARIFDTACRRWEARPHPCQDAAGKLENLGVCRS
jgi:hypothetical protein